MERRMVEEMRGCYDRHSLGVRVLVALIVLSVIGTIVCMTLAFLRIAVEAAVIAAGILVLMGMVCLVLVNGMKYRIEAVRYRNEPDAGQQKALDS